VFRNGAFDSTPFLTLNTATVGNALVTGGEAGLLGVAFHPGYAAAAGTPGRGKFYTYTSEPIVNAATNFTHPELGTGGGNHQSVIREWTASAANPNVIDTSAGAGSSRVVMRINQPQDNHNGGAMKFDAAGRLYVALGDGGGGDDNDGGVANPADGHTDNTGNAQDLSNVYGKILRIDPARVNDPRPARCRPTASTGSRRPTRSRPTPPGPPRSARSTRTGCGTRSG
jgi:hypothetical protein